MKFIMYYYYLGAHRAPLQEVLKGDGEGVVLKQSKENLPRRVGPRP